MRSLAGKRRTAAAVTDVAGDAGITVEDWSESSLQIRGRRHELRLELQITIEMQRKVRGAEVRRRNREGVAVCDENGSCTTGRYRTASARTSGIISNKVMKTDNSRRSIFLSSGINFGRFVLEASSETAFINNLHKRTIASGAKIGPPSSK